MSSAIGICCATHDLGATSLSGSCDHALVSESETRTLPVLAPCYPQVDDTDVVNFLLSTEIIPLCLRTMEMGSELSKTVRGALQIPKSHHVRLSHNCHSQAARLPAEPHSVSTGSSVTRCSPPAPI